MNSSNLMAEIIETREINTAWYGKTYVPNLEFSSLQAQPNHERLHAVFPSQDAQMFADVKRE